MNKKETPGIFEKKNVIIFVSLICALLLAGGYLIYYSESSSIKREKHNEIKAIAELKSHQIIQWRDERLAEAKFFSLNELFIQRTSSLISGKDDSTIKKYLKSTLFPLLQSHGYRNIYILSQNREIIFSLDSSFTGTDKSIDHDIDSVFIKRSFVISDIHESDKQQISIDFIAPVKNADGSVIAVLVFNIDPRMYLFPLIQSWPTPSKTSETFLVRKENESVILLNFARLSENKKLFLRLPMNNLKLPAVQAVLGYKGIYEGIDYRNMEVLAHLSKLENTPWYMVAKVDRREIYSELNFRVTAISVFTLILMLLTSLGLYFIYYSNQNKIKKRLLDELELRVAERTNQLSEAHSNLEAINKELEAFSYSVSHDLRGPLRAMGVLSIQLKENLDILSVDKPKEILNDIIKTTQHMNKLINDLLEFSRLSNKHLKKDIIDMNKLFNNCFNELITLAPGRNIEYKLEKLPYAYGDIALIKQVVVNLLSNAIKFTGNNKITVIKVNGGEINSEKVYCITDNGVGFNSNYSHKLFNVFQRLHSAKEFEGTGAGLAIVKRIIVRHGGRVWAENLDSGGAAFYFSLPA